MSPNHDAAASNPIRTTLLPQNVNPSQCRSKWSVAGMFNSLRGGGRSRGEAASLPGHELNDPRKRKEHVARTQKQKHNSHSTNLQGSIFEDEVDTPATRAAKPRVRKEDRFQGNAMNTPKTYNNMAMVTDPDPRARARWQRRKVIQMVRKNGKLTREEHIAMTERTLTHKSEFIPTSVKKLVMLARQIAGKPIDEAITQMTWSKKKMATEIKYYLEEARDLAVAQRGMSLGRVRGELLKEPQKIRTKDGKWLEITDPTRIYIAQSWVGRGAWLGKKIDYKGRGRMGVIQVPSTSKQNLTPYPDKLSSHIRTWLIN